MSGQPWIKFYPRDWRGDQALRAVSLSARGLWMEMLCVMHEATPYGHLLLGDQPVSDAVLARLVGTSVEEVQVLLVDLAAARVFRRTRGGVIYSKRMTDDHKRSVLGRKAKEAALREAAEKKEEKPLPSRVPSSPPTTQKPEARKEDKDANASCVRFLDAWKHCTAMMRKRSLSQEKTAPYWRTASAKVGGDDALYGCLLRYLREDPDVGRTGGPGLHLWLKDETWAHYLPSASVTTVESTPELEARRIRHFRDTGEWRDAWGQRPPAERLSA
jgi:hypothetical protein